MGKKPTKKKNPQDVTLRNVRAALRRDRMLMARIVALEVRVDALAKRAARTREDSARLT